MDHLKRFIYRVTGYGVAIVVGVILGSVALSLMKQPVPEFYFFSIPLTIIAILGFIGICLPHSPMPSDQLELPLENQTPE